MTNMNNIIEDIKDFFITQRILYGSELIMPSDLIENSHIVSDSQEVEEEIGSVDGQDDLTKYNHEIMKCTKCQLGVTRNKFVFGTGNSNACLMFIGEAPGRDEDLQGKPFIGKAGQLLTLMLKAIGFEREDVFIANVLKCRPPNNRDPLPEEVEKCEPYLLHQISIINPKLIVALGRFAASSLLRTKEALGNLREKIHSYNNVPLIVTYHPAALLRNSQLKKQSWKDLKSILEYLKNNVDSKA